MEDVGPDMLTDGWLYQNSKMGPRYGDNAPMAKLNLFN